MPPFNIFCFFMVLILGRLKLNNFLVVVFLVVSLSSASVFVKSFSQSFNNLTNIGSIRENYHLPTLEIIKEQFDNNYSVLAVEYVLVLYYLDKENYSYIVHPTNHFEEYIDEPLYQFGYMKRTKLITYLRRTNIILCNSIRIHEGSPVENKNFECSKENFENYCQIDTSLIRKDKKN